MLFPFLFSTTGSDPHPNIGLFPGLVKIDPTKAEAHAKAEQERLEILYEHARANDEWANILKQAINTPSPQPEELLEILTELNVIPEPIRTISASHPEEELPSLLPNDISLDGLIKRYIDRIEIAKPNFGGSLFPEYPYHKMFIDIVYYLLEEKEDKEINPTYVAELRKLFGRGKEYQQAGLVIGQGLIAHDHPITANRILETILMCENQDPNIHQNTKLNLIANGGLESKYAENLLMSVVNEDPGFTTEFNLDTLEPGLLHYLNDNPKSPAANFLLGQHYLKIATQTKDHNYSEKATTHFLTSIESSPSLLDFIRYSINENGYLPYITEHAKELQINQTNITPITLYSLLTKVVGGTEFLITYLHQQAERTQACKDWYMLAYHLINDLNTGDRYKSNNLDFTKWSFYKALENKDSDLIPSTTNLGDKLLEIGSYPLAELVFYELAKADPTNDYAKENLNKAKELNK